MKETFHQAVLRNSYRNRKVTEPIARVILWGAVLFALWLMYAGYWTDH
jgi:hypothetical protein